MKTEFFAFCAILTLFSFPFLLYLFFLGYAPRARALAAKLGDEFDDSEIDIQMEVRSDGQERHEGGEKRGAEKNDMIMTTCASALLMHHSLMPLPCPFSLSSLHLCFLLADAVDDGRL
jgi:hypothetical protein